MLSVFNRLAVINILIKEQADGTRKSQFDAVDVDAKQIVKEVVESSDVANKMMQTMKFSMGEASMQLFEECHQNLLENQEEAVTFAQQFIDMCNAGHQVGVN